MTRVILIKKDFQLSRCVHKLNETNVQHYAEQNGILYDIGCEDGNCYIAEAICEDNEQKFKIFECSNGCSNGACI